MPVSSADLLDFADQVASSSASNEAALRASASRAYYAAFHALLPLVAQLPKSSKFRPSSTHITHDDFAQRLADLANAPPSATFGELQVRAGRIVRAVDANRAMRLKADYKLPAMLRPGDAKMQVQRTRMIFRALAEIEAVSTGDITASSNSESGSGA